MSLVRYKLYNELYKFIKSDKGGSQLMKIKLMTSVNNYAKLMNPPSLNYDSSKFMGIASFTGDRPNNYVSFAIAFSKALGSYTNSVSINRVQLNYVPTYTPPSATILPKLLSIKSNTSQLGMISRLSTYIDSWIKTGISILVIPPSVYEITPWT